MKVRITAGQVWCGDWYWTRGMVVDAHEKHLRPLIDSGFAEEVTDDPPPVPAKKRGKVNTEEAANGDAGI